MTEPAREPDYATKADVEVLRADLATVAAELRAEIAAVRTEIAAVRTEIASAESRLTWRLLGGVGALLALFRLLDLLPVG